MPTTISQTELAKAIGASPQTIIEWRKAGIITPRVHEKYCIRYNLAEVESILAERAKAASKKPA